MEKTGLFWITAIACIAIPTALGYFLDWDSAQVDKTIIISLLLVIVNNQIGGAQG